MLGLGLIVSLGSIVFFWLHYLSHSYVTHATYMFGAMGFVCSALCVVIGIDFAVKGLRMLIES